MASPGINLTARPETGLTAIQFYMTVNSAGLEPC